MCVCVCVSTVPNLHRVMNDGYFYDYTHFIKYTHTHTRNAPADRAMRVEKKAKKNILTRTGAYKTGGTANAIVPVEKYYFVIII